MLVIATSANAADISVSKLDSSGRAWVTFEGDIVLSDVEQFQKKTSTISKAIVVMRGDGGKLLAGIEVGKIIRLRNYITLVPDNATNIVKGSGDPAFDKAALAMVRRSDPVPQPPPVVADGGPEFYVARNLQRADRACRR
jgi:hypothetical protein